MTSLKCFKGHHVKKEVNRQLKKTYAYFCPVCDENMFSFEVYNPKECKK